ncbi:MAG: hypothetical protein AAF840_06685, partial [Bacteroidota bacterium]
LGPAENIRCMATHETDGGAVNTEISVKDLGLHPLDLLYLLGFNPESGSGELEARVVRELVEQHSISRKEITQLSFTARQPSWGKEVKTFYEITPLILHLREIFNEAKYVDALDIMIPEDEPDLDNPERLNLTDIKKRVDQQEDDYRVLVATATQFVADKYGDTLAEDINFQTGDLANLEAQLFQIAAFDCPECVAMHESIDPIVQGKDLLGRMRTTIKKAGKRLAKIDALRTAYTGQATTKGQVEHLIAIGRLLFGRNAIILPHFQPKNKADIKTQTSLPLKDNLTRHRTDPHLLNDWMQELSDVRKDIYHLDMSCMLVENFGQEFPTWAPVQFPFQANDYWLGTEFPESFAPAGDYLSLVLFNQEILTDSSSVKVGLIVDEWTEIIPNKSETTGLAFHYDQPDAQAPQTMLLAVNPTVDPKWNWSSLVYTLNETLDMAKIRAVEPDHLENSPFAQVIPTIVSEVVPPQARNYEDDSGQSGATWNNPLGTQVVMDFADNLPQEEQP